ncbi:MAG: hypothetical protein JWM80_2940 [Cyanobacteria bacterium RYN_339]|nr:hypothetical protein [Cyanobacteria bacterium RYN_339]
MAVRKRQQEIVSSQEIRAVSPRRQISGARYTFAAAVTAPSALIFASSYALHPYGPGFYAVVLVALAAGSFFYERAGGRSPLFPAAMAPGTALALLTLIAGLIVMRVLHQHLGTPFAPAIAPLAIYVGLLLVPTDFFAEPEFYTGLLELLFAILGSVA